MKLGRTYPVVLTRDELLLLAYNVLGLEVIRGAGVDIRRPLNMNEDVVRGMRTKLVDQLKLAGKQDGGRGIVDKDQLWRTIGDAAKG